MPPSKKEPMEIKYERHVIRRDYDECWGWKGVKLNGYPYIDHGKENRISARRWTYEQEHGTIPEGFSVISLCGTTVCTNPFHLGASSNKREGKRNGDLGEPNWGEYWDDE